jgi:hypothetical protein
MARKVLTDNGLTVVHGAVSVDGCSGEKCGPRGDRDFLKRRLALFPSLGLKYVHDHGGTRKLAIDDYKIVADNMHRQRDRLSVRYVCQRRIRARLRMSTLLTALKVA